MPAPILASTIPASIHSFSDKSSGRFHVRLSTRPRIVRVPSCRWGEIGLTRSIATTPSGNQAPLGGSYNHRLHRNLIFLITLGLALLLNHPQRSFFRRPTKIFGSLTASHLK